MLLSALVFAFAIPTYGPMPAPAPTAPAYLRVPTTNDEALILNSGSTNTAGYRLRVYASGWTALQQGDFPIRKRVPASLVKRFFADLRAAGPLDAIPSRRCMKSASFGTSMQIGYRGKLSPDLACPSSSAAARTLSIDADALANAAGVSILPRPLPSP